MTILLHYLKWRKVVVNFEANVMKTSFPECTKPVVAATFSATARVVWVNKFVFKI